MELDEKLSILIDLFPSDAFEDLLIQLEALDFDLENAINFIISQKNTPSDPFTHLVKTFPDAEVEAIEAFLLTVASASSDDFKLLESKNLDEITQMFMKQQSSYGQNTIIRRQKEKDLKLSLSEFQTIFTGKANNTWNNPSSSYHPNSSSLNFRFSFLESTDLEDFRSLSNLTGLQVREMAVNLQRERISNLKRATEMFQRGNLTGKSGASYYSDVGNGLSGKIARYHRIAAEKILLQLNPNLSSSNILDLHYLRVCEAQAVTSAFVAAYSRSHGTIVTGRGNHSEAGRSKLAPTVWNILNRAKLNFSFDGASFFLIG